MGRGSSALRQVCPWTGLPASLEGRAPWRPWAEFWGTRGPSEAGPTPGASSHPRRLLNPGRAKVCQGSSLELPSTGAQAWLYPRGRGARRGGGRVSSSGWRGCHPCHSGDTGRGSSRSGLELSQGRECRAQSSLGRQGGCPKEATWHVTRHWPRASGREARSTRFTPGLDCSEDSV